MTIDDKKPTMRKVIAFVILSALLLLLGCSERLTDYQKHPPRYHSGCKVCGMRVCEH